MESLLGDKLSLLINITPSRETKQKKKKEKEKPYQHHVST
jgi:hypothetical protein